MPKVLSDDYFEFLPQYKEVEELDQTKILPSREDASSDEKISRSDEDVAGFNEETSKQAIMLQQHQEEISEMETVSSSNPAASLLSIVAQYNGQDQDLLLINLLKRDQA